MHGIDLKTQMDIVYHSLNDTSKGIIDAACCGAFKRKSAEEAKQLIEDLAKCNMKAPSESSGSNNRTKGSGVIQLNKMTAMETKLDEIMHKLGNQEKECTMLMKLEQWEDMESEEVMRDQLMRIPIKLRKPNI